MMEFVSLWVCLREHSSNPFILPGCSGFYCSFRRGEKALRKHSQSGVPSPQAHGAAGGAGEGKLQVLGKSSSERSSTPGLQQLSEAQKTPEEMRPPLDSAAGALLSVPSPCPGCHTCTQGGTCRISWSTDPAGLPPWLEWWVLPWDALSPCAQSCPISTCNSVVPFSPELCPCKGPVLQSRSGLNAASA